MMTLEKFSVSQVASETGLSIDQVRHRIQAGYLHAEKVNGKYEIDAQALADFKDWLEARRPEPIPLEKIPLRPEEVAANLMVSVETVLNLLHKNEIRYFMPGTYLYRIMPSALWEYKRQHATPEGWPELEDIDWSKPLLTVQQVAEQTHQPEGWLHGAIQRGTLRAVRIHRMLRLFAETVQGLRYGFPATTTKMRARYEHEQQGQAHTLNNVMKL
jgi:excisionase family DNA binding protein